VFLPVYAALAIAFLFYIAIPIAGAFGVRNQWRAFRRRAIELSTVPVLKYRDLSDAIAKAKETNDTALGPYRIYGHVEAMAGTNRIWVRGASVSALVDLSHAPMYILEGGAGEAGSVERVAWKSVSSLGEGTRIFAAGKVMLEAGRPVFVDRPEEPLLAVSHDGSEGDLLMRLISGGRRTNEYWNSLGRLSIAFGLALSSGLLVYLTRNPILPSVKALAFFAALIPVLPLMPPGLALFFAYRVLWRRALSFRIARDLALLPLRYFSHTAGAETRAALPGGGSYAMRHAGSGEPPPRATRFPSLEAMVVDAADPPSWTIFSPEGSTDPAAESVALPGDPETLAASARLKAALAAGAAGMAMVLAIVVNYTVAFMLWRGLS
jgi:hypothetical protein